MKDPAPGGDALADEFASKMRISNMPYETDNSNDTSDGSDVSDDSDVESLEVEDLAISGENDAAKDNLNNISPGRRLQTKVRIVFFTPVVVPAGKPRPTGDSISNLSSCTANMPPWVDPFEPFGRALQDKHKFVHHVPYIPKVGYTDTHAFFLKEADLVITVICEPDRNPEESLACQRAFATDVNKAEILRICYDNRPISRHILFQFAKNTSYTNDAGIQAVMSDEYDDTKAEQLAKMVTMLIPWDLLYDYDGPRSRPARNDRAFRKPEAAGPS